MADKTHHDLLVNWLKNAYTIENTLVSMLENQAGRATEFPELRSQLQRHREATQQHADMVKQSLNQLGEDVSEVRAQASKFFGEVQSRMLGAFGDSVVRDAVIGSMAEQLEIATYNSIIALAEKLDEQGIVNTCSKILEDEHNMQEFLNDNIDDLVEQAYDQDQLMR